MIIINDIIAFILELISFYFYYTWIERLPLAGWLKLVLAIIVIGGLILIWGTYLSPKANNPLQPTISLLLKFIILFLPYLQFIPEKVHWTLIGGGIILVNIIIQAIAGRGNWGN